MKKTWLLLFIFLILILVLIWYSVIAYTDSKFRIIACDVGQGDSFLITYKSFQILVDGGPNNKVLGCLSDNMPFWDRTVDVVVLSHPQKDHFGGLIEVFKDYEVKYFLTSPLEVSSHEWSVLKDLVGGSGVKVLNPVSGNKYRFGLIYLDILHPSEKYLLTNFKDYIIGNGKDVLGGYTSKKDPNEFSLVLILSFKDFDALFTGDIGPKLSDEIASRLLISDKQRVEYIKIPHHGSKNGLSKALLDAIDPEIAVISVGKGNSYGHPHKEILELLDSYGVRVFRTDEMGDVVLESDGESYWLK